MSLLSHNIAAFYAVAKIGTVHGAARKLGITQTGVTQRLRALERELGVSLFLRSRSGMKTTVEGEALFRYCCQAEDLEGPVLSQIRGGGERSEVHVTVSGPTSLMTSRVVPQCVPCYAKFPSLQLHFKMTDDDDGAALLRSGLATFAIIARSDVPKDLDSKLLKPERYLLVATSGWKGRRLADILASERIVDFHEHDATTKAYLKRFELDGALSRPRLYANNNEAIIHLFKAGVGLGVLTAEIAAESIANGSLIALNGGKTLDEHSALCWYPRNEKPGYFAEIIKSIK